MVRRKFITRAGFGIAWCVLTAWANSAQAQQTIKPGQSIGRISLEMPRRDVWKHVGKPTEIHFFQIAEHSYTWDDWTSNGQREYVTSYRGRVVQIEREITYSEAQINQGEGRKDMFSSIRKRHPHLKVSLYDEHEDNGSTIVADDIPQGMAWAVYIHHCKDNDFNTHLLSEIGPDRVIVHRTGANALPNISEISDLHDPCLGNIRAWFAAQPPTHKEHKGK